MKVMSASDLKMHAPKRDTGERKNVLYLDVVEADDLSGPQGRKKMAGCLYPNGAFVYGKGAENQPHPDLHVSVGAGDRVTWLASRPFQVTFKDDGGDAFIDTPPWHSKRRPDGVHIVVSSQVRPNLPGLSPTNFIEVEFIVHMSNAQPPHAPDPGIEPIDPHIIIEP